MIGSVVVADIYEGLDFIILITILTSYEKIKKDLFLNLYKGI